MLIPTINDSPKQIKELIKFVKTLNVPLHFSAYYPCYKLKIHATPTETVKKARKLALKELDYVYTGNIIDDEGSSTYCPKCKEVVIKRKGYNVEEIKCKCKK